MRYRVNINEYLYLEFIYQNGRIEVVYDRDIPQTAYYFEDTGSKYILKYLDEEIAELDKKTGKFSSTNPYFTTLEIKNYSEDKRHNGTDRDYQNNRRLLKEKRKEADPYPIELHTHFMEVLSPEQFLEILELYLPQIPLDKEGKIVEIDFDDRESYKLKDSRIDKWIDYDMAIRDPKIIEQLRVPTDRQVNFGGLQKALKCRSALLNLATFNLIKYELEGEIEAKEKLEHENKRTFDRIQKAYLRSIEEIKEAKYQEDAEELEIAKKANQLAIKTRKLASKQSPIDLTNVFSENARIILHSMNVEFYARMLIKSLEELKSQGVKYVEFSFSNAKTIKRLLRYMEDNNLGVEGITFKFLLSQNRNCIERAYKDNVDALEELLMLYPDVIGFDLMGQEAEIKDIDLEDNHGDSCDNLYSKLKYTIKQLLRSQKYREKPTLRLHAGEIFYNDEDSLNNNPLLILIILKRIEQELNVNLSDVLNIRIGHGLHFKDNEEYYDLLKHFGIVVEICTSSNFALDNIRDLSEMPIQKYIDHQIPFVIGTDGGGVYLTTLKQESSHTLEHSLQEVIRKITSTRYHPPKKASKFVAKPDTVGLNLDLSIDDYLLQENISGGRVAELFESAPSKKKFMRLYFRNLFSDQSKITEEDSKNVSELKRSFVETQAFFHNLIINEAYFDNKELRIIDSTLDKINSLIEEKRYSKAAILLVSLQATMKYKVELTDVLYLMKAYDLDFKKCLTTDIVDCLKIDAIDWQKNDMNQNNKSMIRESCAVRQLDILDKKELDNSEYAEIINNYVNSKDCNFDILSHDYFNNESETEKVYSEIKRIINRLQELDNREDSLLIKEKLLLTKKYLDEQDLIKAAVSVVCIEDYLGIDTRLEVIDIYMKVNDYNLDTFLEQDEIEIEKNTRGGKSR